MAPLPYLFLPSRHRRRLITISLANIFTLNPNLTPLHSHWPFNHGFPRGVAFFFTLQQFFIQIHHQTTHLHQWRAMKCMKMEMHKYSGSWREVPDYQKGGLHVKGGYWKSKGVFRQGAVERGSHQEGEVVVVGKPTMIFKEGLFRVFF